MFICNFCGKETDSKRGNIYHQNRCIENPNKLNAIPKSEVWKKAMNDRKGRGANQFTKYGKEWVVKESTIEKMRKRMTGNKLSEDIKKSISISMKKAHSEKRAWNIGKSRWNNKPSWPEQFFMKVIENEFLDKNYE